MSKSINGKVVDEHITELVVSSVEDDAVIVIIDGWRMRVYKSKSNKTEYAPGHKITVSYTGDLNHPQTLEFGKLK